MFAFPFAAMLAVALAASPNAPTPPPPVGLQFDGGVRVVLQETPDAQTVVMVARFAHGSGDDDASNWGASHLLEHLWFRSDSGDGVDLWSAYESRGCTLSASTAARYTQFVTACPKSEQAFLVAQWLRQLSDPLAGVSADHVALETGVVFQEHLGRDTASAELYREMYRKLQPEDSPVHERLALGSRTADGLDLDALIGQAPLIFAVEGATAVLAGPIDAQQVQQMLTTALGAHTSLQALSDDVEETVQITTRADDVELAKLTLRYTLPQLVLAWNLHPSLGESSSMDVFATAMGRTLWIELYDVADVHGVSCYTTSDSTHPALVCALQLSPRAHQTEVLNRVAKALGVALSGTGLKAMKAEVSARKTQLPQSVLRGLYSPGQSALRLSHEVATYGTLRTTDEVVGDIRAWNPTPLLKAARGWFNYRDAAKIWVMPGAPHPKLTAAPPRVSQSPVAVVMPDVRSVPLEDSVSKMRVFDSGLTVVAVQRPSSPVVLATVRVPGGLGQTPYPLAVFSEAFSAAPGVRETKEISTGEAVYAGGAEVWALGPADQAHRTLNAALAMVALRVPTFSDEHHDAIDRWATRSEASILASADRPETLAEALLWSHVTPNHRPSKGLDVDDIQMLAHTRRTSVLAHLFQQYTPQHGLLVVSGPQAPDELLEQAARSFEDWQTPGGVSSVGPTLSAPAERVQPGRFQLVDPSLNRSTLRWQCPLPGGVDEARTRVIEALVDDLLWRRFREQSGLVYTPWAQVISWPDGTVVLDMGLHTDAGQTAEAWALLYGLVEDLPEVATQEMPFFRDRVRRQLHLDATSMAGTEYLVMTAFDEGGDVTQPIAHLYDRLDAITAERLGVELGPCFHRGTAVIYGPVDAEIEGFELVLPDAEAEAL